MVELRTMNPDMQAYLRYSIAALGFVLLVATPLRAQSDATLQGCVFDASEAVIRGATVRITSSPIGFDRSVRSDLEGRFHVTAIPAGTYTVMAAASGFRSRSSPSMETLRWATSPSSRTFRPHTRRRASLDYRRALTKVRHVRARPRGRRRGGAMKDGRRLGGAFGRLRLRHLR